MYWVSSWDGENRLTGCLAVPEELKQEQLLLIADSNWGPQDALSPQPNGMRTIEMGG